MLRQPPPTTGPLHEEVRGGRIGSEFRANEHLAVHNARARFIGSGSQEDSLLSLTASFLQADFSVLILRRFPERHSGPTYECPTIHPEPCKQAGRFYASIYVNLTRPGFTGSDLSQIAQHRVRVIQLARRVGPQTHSPARYIVARFRFVRIAPLDASRFGLVFRVRVQER